MRKPAILLPFVVVIFGCDRGKSALNSVQNNESSLAPRWKHAGAFKIERPKDEKSLDLLDDALYKLDEDFDALDAAYIKAHPNEFFISE